MNFWKTPSYQLDLEAVEAVEVIRLKPRGRPIGEGWPLSFWEAAQERKRLEDDEKSQVIELILNLDPGQPNRCHMPPWGITFSGASDLLYSMTICFHCYNAYVSSPEGRILRAFARRSKKTTALLRFFKSQFD